LIVIDASFVVDYLLQAAAKPAVAAIIKHQDYLVAPSLIEYEVGTVFRRYNLKGELTDQRASRAFADFYALPLEIHDAEPLLSRAWNPRRNFTFYDASYVVLAETLSLSLYTTDKRLAAAPGHNAKIVCL
jgi:predicted nucleic acid-binding protein